MKRVAEARAAGDAIAEIHSTSGQTVEMVADITASIREQSAASTAIAQQVERIAAMSDEANSGARQTAGSAEELNALAEQMVGAISRYRY